MLTRVIYRLFGLGGVPKALRPVLAHEGVVLLDQGIGGWLVTKRLKGPGKRYRHRTEGFMGCLAITKVRLIAYTFGKCQINIAVNHPKITHLYVDAPAVNRLWLSFEASHFRDDWHGVFLLKFSTTKAHAFRDALLGLGLQAGVCDP